MKSIRICDGLVMNWPMLRAWMDRQIRLFGTAEAQVLNYYGDKKPGEHDMEYVREHTKRVLIAS